jgi:hypothetical protein
VTQVVLVQAITPRPNGGGSLQGRFFVEKICHLLYFEWKVMVYHSYSETNQCANALANFNCSMVRDRELFNVCPSAIKNLLFTDLLGITFPQSIP